MIIKTVSSNGHTVYKEDDPIKAITYLRKVTSKGDKWVYVNLHRVRPEELTVENLQNADDIMITNALIGG